MTSRGAPAQAHPLALWLHRVADNLGTIFVRDRDDESSPWVSRPLADLPTEVAAHYVADFLQRWPFVPVRVVGAPLAEESGPLSLEQLKAALHRERAIVQHFEEIRERVFAALACSSEAAAAGDDVEGTTQALVDAAALVGYLQLLLHENERLVAYLIGLEEAGTISREELELLMGLRQLGFDPDEHDVGAPPE